MSLGSIRSAQPLRVMPAWARVSLTGVILAAQVAVHEGIYWLRGQTFIVSPGRFRQWESILGSDFVLFLFPILATIGAVFLLWSRERSRAPWVLAAASALAFATAFLAFLFAFNYWGT